MSTEMKITHGGGIINKVGIEAEFLLLNDKNEMIVPPASWDRDGFPLLGEIRGKEAKTAGEAVSNFVARKMEIIEKLNKGHSIVFAALERCPLALYRKANKAINYADKAQSMGQIKNIHGIDIEDFSDQIVEKGKIQGIRVSCGLHIHFSSEEHIEKTFEIPQYEQVILPISVGLASGGKITAKEAALPKELLQPCIYLHKHKGYEKKEKFECRAGRLNKPAIQYIVDRMDRQFFDKFAPKAADRTKFRQPGFFELKPYGFEYRSLPMTAEVEANLLEIVTFAFELLKEVNEY